MRDEHRFIAEDEPTSSGTDISASKFAESYASFNRIINGLQRQYLELKEEFTAQNEKLAESNRRLMTLTESNLMANEFLNGILDSMPVAVLTVDREGKITHMNPAGSIMFNKDAKRAVGTDYAQIFPDAIPSSAGALSTIRTGKTVSSVEKEVSVAGDRKLKLSVSTSLLKDQEGNSVGAVEVFQDLTKVRKMEHEISRLNTLAALGEMAATIAHEIRNPLSGVGGFAALLERDIDKADPRALLVQKVKKGVEALNHTVTKLLNYTRFNELNRLETDYIQYLKSSVDQFRSDHAHVQNLSIKLNENGLNEPNLVIVAIDKLLFRQCLFNMFSNSVEAAGTLPRIKVSAIVHQLFAVPSEFANKINLDFDEVLVVTTIVDNGPGIKPDHRDKIFAPFFTTKSSGSGLGLAVAWKLIKAHGGDIVLGESSSAGTTFYILLPARIENKQLESNL